MPNSLVCFGRRCLRLGWPCGLRLSGRLRFDAPRAGGGRRGLALFVGLRRRVLCLAELVGWLSPAAVVLFCSRCFEDRRERQWLVAVPGLVLLHCRVLLVGF